MEWKRRPETGAPLGKSVKYYPQILKHKENPMHYYFK